MKKEEIKAHLKAEGWIEDRWGHMKKTIQKKDGTDILMRYKFQKHSLRCEVRGELSKRWINVCSGYFKYCYLDAKGKLKISKVNSGTQR